MSSASDEFLRAMIYSMTLERLENRRDSLVSLIDSFEKYVDKKPEFASMVCEFHQKLKAVYMRLQIKKRVDEVDTYWKRYY